MDIFYPDLDGAEMEHTEKAVGGLVVAGRDGAVGLEMTDIALDTAALAIEALVPADLARAVRFRWDDGTNAASLEISADGVGVVCLSPRKSSGALSGRSLTVS